MRVWSKRILWKLWLCVNSRWNSINTDSVNPVFVKMPPPLIHVKNLSKSCCKRRCNDTMYVLCTHTFPLLSQKNIFTYLLTNSPLFLVLISFEFIYLQVQARLECVTAVGVGSGAAAVSEGRATTTCLAGWDELRNCNIYWPVVWPVGLPVNL